MRHNRSQEIRVLQEAIRALWKEIEGLRETFPRRKFTLDGRLVGDFGEVLAEALFDIVLDDTQRSLHDAVTTDGSRKVSIKAGFQRNLTFGKVPDYMIGISLDKDGGYSVVYNGPGRYIAAHFAHRNGIGEKLLRFPVSEIEKINSTVPREERVAKR